MSKRIDKIAITSFRGFRQRQEVEVAGDVVLVVGTNGTGKSSLADAVVAAASGGVPDLTRWEKGKSEVQVLSPPAETVRTPPKLKPNQRTLFFLNSEEDAEPAVAFVEQLNDGMSIRGESLSSALISAKTALEQKRNRLNSEETTKQLSQLEEQRQHAARSLTAAWQSAPKMLPKQDPLELLRNENLPSNWQDRLRNVVRELAFDGWLSDKDDLASGPVSVLLHKLATIAVPVTHAGTAVPASREAAELRKAALALPRGDWRLSTDPASEAPWRSRTLLTTPGDIFMLGQKQLQDLERQARAEEPFDDWVENVHAAAMTLFERLHPPRTPPQDSALAELASAVEATHKTLKPVIEGAEKLEAEWSRRDSERSMVTEWISAQRALSDALATLPVHQRRSDSLGSLQEIRDKWLTDAANHEAHVTAAVSSVPLATLEPLRAAAKSWAVVEEKYAVLQSNRQPEEHIEQQVARVDAALAAVRELTGFGKTNRLSVKSRLFAAINDAPTEARVTAAVQAILEIFPQTFLAEVTLTRSGKARATSIDELDFKHLSDGQKVVVRLATLFVLNTLMAHQVQHRLIVLDDIADDLDVAQLPAVAALVRAMAYAPSEADRRRVVITTHHELIARGLLELLMPPQGCVLRVLTFEDFKKDRGPSIKSSVVPHKDDPKPLNDTDARQLFQSILQEALGSLSANQAA